jgi:nucleotide-binding universal stress UspA family protein
MKILLATDGSPCSDAAVEEVARRQWPPDSQVRVVSVVEPPAPLVAEPYMLSVSFYEEAERVKREQAIEALERAAAKLSAGGATLSVSTDILLGSPKRVIVEEADEWNADLIVVGSHGYKSWERMLLGSVSQTVAAHAACSVEIVRCKKSNGQGAGSSGGRLIPPLTTSPNPTVEHTNAGS